MPRQAEITQGSRITSANRENAAKDPVRAYETTRTRSGSSPNDWETPTDSCMASSRNREFRFAAVEAILDRNAGPSKASRQSQEDRGQGDGRRSRTSSRSRPDAGVFLQLVNAVVVPAWTG